MQVTVNLDVNDLDRMEAFWTAALDYERRGATGPFRAFTPKSGSGPTLILSLVPEAKGTVKNRMHLDLDHPKDFDIEAEAARLEALGARRITKVDDDVPEMEWIVMADPEGNEFCVCRG